MAQTKAQLDANFKAYTSTHSGSGNPYDDYLETLSDADAKTFMAATNNVSTAQMDAAAKSVLDKVDPNAYNAFKQSGQTFQDFADKHKLKVGDVQYGAVTPPSPTKPKIPTWVWWTAAGVATVGLIFTFVLIANKK